MGSGPFDRVEDRVEAADPSADPATYWRTGFTLPAVEAGYAYDREAVRTDLVHRLRANDIALVGGLGTGKSTVCKSVACTWYEREYGPVYYTDTPQPGTATPILDGILDDSDGHALVVLEDATVDDGRLATEVAAVVGDRTDASVLLEIDQTALSDPGVVDELQPLLGDVLTVYDLPPLDRDAFVDAVETFESLTDNTLSKSPDAVYTAIQDRGVEGSELMHLSHSLVTGSGDGMSTLEQTVQTLHERHEADTVRGKLALLVNLLNAADIPLYPEFLFALKAPKQEIDDAVGALCGDLLVLQPQSPPFRTYHRLFSSLYLERVVETCDRPHERFARVFRAVLRPMDPETRNRLWEWARENSEHVPDHRGESTTSEEQDLLQSSARTSQSAIGARAQVVEQIFAVGRAWPALAPLFGTSEHEALDLTESCSSMTVGRVGLIRGQMYFERGDHEQALAEYDTAITALDDAPARVRDRLCVECLIGSGRVATRQADFDRARNYHNEAHTIATDIGDRRGRARSHVHLGVVALKTGALRQATAHLIAGERLFRAVSDDHGVGEARQRLGIAYLNRGKLQSAAEALDDAIDRYQRLGTRVDVARAQNNRGLVAYEAGDFDTAATYFRRSLASNRETGRQGGIMNNLLNLGNLAIDRGDDAAAEDHYQEALSLARDVNDRASEATLLNNLGVVALEHGDIAAAADRFRQSLDVAQDIGDRRGEARAHNNLGEVALERGDYGTADDHHQAALNTYKHVGDRPGRASTQFHLGEVARNRGTLDAAADHLEQALTIFRDVENEQRTGETLAALARLATQRDDPETAFTRFLDSIRSLEDGRKRDAVLTDLQNLIAAHNRPDWQSRIDALSDADLSSDHLANQGE